MVMYKTTNRINRSELNAKDCDKYSRKTKKKMS